MRSTTSRTKGKISRRRNLRLTTAMTVLIDGEQYAATDWSLGGFRIGGYHGKRQPGERIDVDLYGVLEGLRLGGGAIATIVRRDPGTGELACTLDEFIGDAWDQLEQLAVRRLRRPRLAR